MPDRHCVVVKLRDYGWAVRVPDEAYPWGVYAVMYFDGDTMEDAVRHCAEWCEAVAAIARWRLASMETPTSDDDIIDVLRYAHHTHAKLDGEGAPK